MNFINNQNGTKKEFVEANGEESDLGDDNGDGNSELDDTGDFLSVLELRFRVNLLNMILFFLVIFFFLE